MLSNPQRKLFKYIALSYSLASRIALAWIKQ